MALFRRVFAAGFREMHLSHLLVCDFDGVVADSEVVANTILAEMISQQGVPTTLQECYSKYMGRGLVEVISKVEADLDKKLPDSFQSDFHSRLMARFRQGLNPVNGAPEFLEYFAHLPKCIASASSPDRLELCIDVLGLERTFGAHVYSASLVARGKPHPDIFLYAARQMDISPSRAIVIEDSAKGVRAGVAAGMIVIGLLAASHIPKGHGDRLYRAGAHHVAATFADARATINEILGDGAQA